MMRRVLGGDTGGWGGSWRWRLQHPEFHTDALSTLVTQQKIKKQTGSEPRAASCCSGCGGSGIYLQPNTPKVSSYSRRAGTERTAGPTRGFDLALLGGGRLCPSCPPCSRLTCCRSVCPRWRRRRPDIWGGAISRLPHACSSPEHPCARQHLVLWVAVCPLGGGNPQGRGGGGPPAGGSGPGGHYWKDDGSN